jgi:hypothetical protein
MAKVYQSLGAPEAFVLEGEDSHQGSREKIRERMALWFDRRLSGTESPIESRSHGPDAYSAGELRCATPAGLGGRSLWDILRLESAAQETEPLRIVDVTGALTLRDFTRRGISARLTRTPSLQLEMTPVSGFRMLDARVTRMSFVGEDRVLLPALLFSPLEPEGRSIPIVYLGDQGKPKRLDSEIKGVAALVKEGFTVVALDPRGMGETRLNPSWTGDTPADNGDTLLACALLRHGESLPAARVRDVLAVVDSILSSTGARRVPEPSGSTEKGREPCWL